MADTLVILPRGAVGNDRPRGALRGKLSGSGGFGADLIVLAASDRALSFPLHSFAPRPHLRRGRPA